jgi:toxin ParE1/3/4
MTKVKFTKIAVKDLSDIWNYTADNWSERQANIYY